MNEIYEKICELCGKDNVFTDEPMKNHTTLKVGGNASYLVTPETKEDISKLFKFAHDNNIPYFVMGNGSNLCVSDAGYKGIIIDIHKKHNKILVEGEQITADAGALLSKVGREALNKSLTGFEELSGIPGTVGGAVAMNAGAYGAEVCDCLECCTCLTLDGVFVNIKASDMELSYRNSRVFRDGLIVTDATFSLKKGLAEDISERMNELSIKRRNKQPLEYPSAGSTFKRPEGNFAGKLIEEAGLRGYTVGGMQVSMKHCGFVINRENGTANDFVELVEYIRKKVYENSGVMLEPEVKMLGF